MDPKLNNLDPKLQETYERVMGTTTPSTTPPAAPGPAPLIDNTNATDPLKNMTPDLPQADSSIPTTPYTPDNLRFQAAIQNPVASPTAPPSGVAAPKESSSMLKILYIVGAIVFFVVYTVFWVKIFNLPLPF